MGVLCAWTTLTTLSVRVSKMSASPVWAASTAELDGGAVESGDVGDGIGEG